MSAYVVVELTVKDARAKDRYSTAAGPILRGGFHYYPGLSMPDCACGGLHPHLSFFDEGSSVEQEHPGADCTRDRLV